MRTYDVTIRNEGVERQCTVDSPWNIRAVLLLMYIHSFGRAPAFHWAASGDLCMGQAWSNKGPSRARYEVVIHQRNLMHEAYNEAQWILWHAKQPRLAASRAD